MKSPDTSDSTKLFEEDRFEEAKLIHKIFVLFAAFYLCFSVVDYLYAPDRIIEFLFLRTLYCVVPLTIFFIIDKVKNFRQSEYLAALHAMVAAGVITYMIYVTSGIESPYYAGLNLVAIAALCFFAFSRLFFWITAALIFLPYFLCAWLLDDISRNKTGFVMNSFFIAGTVMSSALIHHFKDFYRSKNVQAKLKLYQEIEQRNEIIEQRASEAISLSSLHAQFSPQIVESIKKGKINIDTGGQRVQICSIFIDIVNSTEKVTRLDKDKVDKVLSRFLDDSILILLKYDITIDKFLGDGLLGFCNAPLRRADYVSRVLNAALEIREKLESDREFFERNWKSKLEIRCGIAKGYANVGFYGSKKYFKSYTAIGAVVNLASRLCAAADPDQIIIDFDVFEDIQDEFETGFLGKKTLKGFEGEIIHIYEVLSRRDRKSLSTDVSECPKCGSLLILDTNAEGHFTFTCRNCDSDAMGAA